MERIPSRWRYTVFAFMIWLFLVAYILWTGNVYGYVIIALFGIFILPRCWWSCWAIEEG